MEITSVKFRKNNAVYILRTNDIPAPAGSRVIAETEHGVDIGTVLRTITKDPVEEKEIKGKLLRAATDEDISKISELDEIERKAFTACRDKYKEKKLEMKLVNVKSLFDRSKIIFYFVAENRIDFRELVRELAAEMQARGYKHKSPLTAEALEEAQRSFKSYDPASGTYLGYDGIRHPCP